MTRLKVHGPDGINFVENAFTPREEMLRYYQFAEPIETKPNPEISIKFNHADKEIGLDQGKNGFIVINEKEIQKVIDALEGAKIILALGS